MRLPNAPDLTSPRRMALTALAVTLVVATVMGIMDGANLAVSLGDTDDATRLVLVRGLLSGQGWWDQHFMRFQPPEGVYMHWSRLLDGGIAGLEWLFRLGLSNADAEIATRFVWPLLWIYPAVLAALMIAKRLGDAWLGQDKAGEDKLGRASVFACAVILLLDLPIYTAQFHPGRVDHHDVQMALCLLTLAGACLSRAKAQGGLVAGLATGLGLAIGLEAMVFEVVIGAAIALGVLFDPKKKQFAAAYGLSLVAATLLAYAIQTPPWRWGLTACDAIAFNLVAGVTVGGLGLALVSLIGAKRPFAVRLIGLFLVAAAAGGLYLWLDPQCRHGFFADVDKRIGPIWLNYVNEVRPITWFARHDQPTAVGVAFPWLVALSGWIGLGLKAERRTANWGLMGATLILGIGLGAAAVRMSGYAEWFAVPIMAAAMVIPAARYARFGVLAVGLAAALGAPTTATSLAMSAARQFQKKPVVDKAKPSAAPPAKGVAVAAAKPGPPSPTPKDHCFETKAYASFAKVGPPGLVLSEVDLGPFIVAHTANSALAAPYHRMSWGILKAHALFAAKADDTGAAGAQALVRQAGITYVLECRFHSRHGDRSGMTRDSLQKRLDAGQPPAWLEPLSAGDAPLQAYRVRPLASPEVGRWGAGR